MSDVQYHCKYAELKDPELLTPHPRNSNNHPERQIELLSKIINHTGFRHPVVVSNLSGYIVAGHGRVAAAKQLAIDVPVEYQDFKNEAEEFEFLIADNKIAELAQHDDGLLLDNIKELGLEDFELLGLDDFELPSEPDPAKEEIEDDVPENVDTRCKPGDLWILGEHRLLCGDATDVNAVDKLMAGAKADMVFTDPPYGMKYHADWSKGSNIPGAHSSLGSKGLKHKKVIGDFDDFKVEFIQSILALNVDEIFIWGADYFAEHLPDKNDGSWIVWDKRTRADGEVIKQLYGSEFELCWSKQKHKRLIARILHSGICSVENDKRVHPTQKPVKLAEWFFDKWGKDKTNIIDLYGGSGSTLIACDKTNRKCFMMEIDPHYCDVILSRWEKYSGKEAKLWQGQE